MNKKVLAMACALLAGGLFNGTALAQDERFFRRIFTDELLDEKPAPPAKVEASTAYYSIDLNRDGLKEKIRAVKKDGSDFFQIRDRLGRTVFEAALETKGVESALYQVRLKTLSKNADALILYFDEGNSGNLIFKSTARIYVAVIENRSLEEIYFQRGPAFYYEKEKMDFSYAKRHYKVKVADHNQDGVKEISVSYGHIQRIMFYLGKGRWRRF